MLNVRFLGNKIQNIILEYNDVEISIAIQKSIKCDSDHDLYDLDIDSIMLTHAKRGNISKLYTRGMNDLVYPEVNITSELQRIMKFIDEFNRLAG